MVTETTNTSLDQFKYLNLTQTDHHVSEYQRFSDHYPILLQWTWILKPEKNQSFRDLQIVKDEQASAMYISDLQSQLKETEGAICFKTDTSASFNNFAAVFIKFTSYYAPMRINTITQFKKKPKWFNNTLKNLKTK